LVVAPLFLDTAVHFRRVELRDLEVLRGTLTPARRALDRPIAIACLRDFTGCLPRLACSISFLTNFPARVLGDFARRVDLCVRLPVLLLLAVLRLWELRR
jgi:hypothetical protein